MILSFLCKTMMMMMKMTKEEADSRVDVSKAEPLGGGVRIQFEYHEMLF
jgi:hypothetical protein